MKSLVLPVATLCVCLSLGNHTHGKSAVAVDHDLGFKAAFPRPFHQKKYFGLAVTGASIVAAGAFTYATAGAGAPVAATGVSTVASWVAGGGAGSYMAGLSTIGGWFGGNAILGAAILNGISLGTVGGSGTFATLSAGQKALVVTSIAATALDGVAVLGKPDTKEVEFQVTLPVPRALADDRLRSLIDSLADANKALADLFSNLEAAAAERKVAQGDRSATPTVKDMKREQQRAARGAERKKIEEQIAAEIERASAQSDTNRNLVVLAVLAHNLGQPDKFRALLDRVDEAALVRTSYFKYLRAVAAIQVGHYARAEKLLEESWGQDQFSIEPPVLLVNLLGAKDFTSREARISEIATRARQQFDDDAYAPRLSLVSLHYRIGSQALHANRCDRALDDFNLGNEALSRIDKYVTGKDIRNLLDLGKANALHCLGNTRDANAVFDSVRKRASNQETVALLCAQYTGGCNK
jgi:hypothetical protein